MDNTLPPGGARLGWLYDDDAGTDMVAVMLQNTGTRISLTVPVKSLLTDPYARWFDLGWAVPTACQTSPRAPVSGRPGDGRACGLPSNRHQFQ